MNIFDFHLDYKYLFPGEVLNSPAHFFLTLYYIKGNFVQIYKINLYLKSIRFSFILYIRKEI
ncbi:hypothetical protein ACFP3I_15875 [Chryseobacterium arachidis]|uniref:hypothetical protein n=1 Tax=Chryseobacterium arachidis TaxID=1416778 RepID=UPI0036204A3F